MRRRLLYENPHYLTFLRAFLLSHTVLYLGFSFTDAYLNELRSELLARLDQTEGSDPVAYAVINDVSALTQEHYRRHEGIEILAYDTDEGADYSGFDRILEAINKQTNPVMRYRSLLAGKRLLWVDPRWEMNFQRTHDYFDMRAGHEVLDLLRSAEEALKRLAAPPDGRAYDHCERLRALLPGFITPETDRQVPHWCCTPGRTGATFASYSKGHPKPSTATPRRAAGRHRAHGRKRSTAPLRSMGL